jgi:hypothetical protein
MSVREVCSRQQQSGSTVHGGVQIVMQNGWPPLSSLRTGGPSRTFYDHKRGERLVHSQALLALARRLVDVLWALLRDVGEFTQQSRTRCRVSAQRGE